MQNSISEIYYLPPYEQEFWHYQNANIENIRKAISEFPWEKRFANSGVTESSIVNEVIRTTLSVFIFFYEKTLSAQKR